MVLKAGDWSTTLYVVWRNFGNGSPVNMGDRLVLHSVHNGIIDTPALCHPLRHVSYWVSCAAVNCYKRANNGHRQHNVVPSEPELTKQITHVVLAFMRSDVFNSDQQSPEFPLFTTVGEVREKFHHETKVMVAVGGWGDSKGFEEANKDAKSRKRWCENVRKMIDLTGADGVDIDWEYPG